MLCEASSPECNDTFRLPIFSSIQPAPLLERWGRVIPAEASALFAAERRRNHPAPARSARSIRHREITNSGTAGQRMLGRTHHVADRFGVVTVVLAALVFTLQRIYTL